MSSSNHAYSDSAFEILPEMGIQKTKQENVIDLIDRAAAFCDTAMVLHNLGMDLPEPDEDDEELAEKLVSAYAEDPYETSKAVTSERASSITPAALLLVHDTLEKFSGVVVKDSLKIRHYVTNKLIIESENPDAKIRMKALELLGKMSDVGLFTEKRHVTVENTSADELRDQLRSSLERLKERASEREVNGQYEVLENNND